MEALFKQHFWVVKALGLVLATGLGASAFSNAVGSSILLDGGEPEAETDGAAEGDEDEDLEFGDNPFTKSTTTGKKKTGLRSSALAAKDRAVDQILKRNVFCPSCAPIETAPMAGVAGFGTGADGASLIKPGEVKSSLPLRLTATMESTDPALSLATVYDTESGAAGLYGIGDSIRPGVVVTEVDLGLLHIRNNAALEYLEMGSGEIPPPKKPAEGAAAEEKPEEPPKPENAIEGAEDAIKCPSENLCVVERAFVEKLMANPALLAKQARIVPSTKDGESQGFKFYGIRKGSLPKLLGLKNGDMLTAVNGEALTSVDQAMALYAKLRRASNLNVTIVRKGQEITKEVQIQ
jgi:general secretion pathway protein C